MKKILFIFFLLVSFSSCIKEIDFINGDFEKLPVANCLFGNDTSFILHLSMNQAVNDFTDTNFISNANVEITVDDKTYILHYLDSGKYYSDIVPEVNKEYKLNINFQDFSLNSKSIIPAPSQILDIDSTLKPHFDSEEQSVCYSAYIKIQDNPNEENYYELSIQVKATNLNIYGDTTYQFLNCTFATNQISPISNEKQKFNSNSLFFRDNFVNDNNILEFPVNFYPGSDFIGIDGEYHLRGKYTFILKTVSKDYYYYYKSMIMTDEMFNTAGSINTLTNLSFTNKPVKIYTNIENGYGIFAGYSVDTLSISNPVIDNSQQ